MHPIANRQFSRQTIAIAAVLSIALQSSSGWVRAADSFKQFADVDLKISFPIPLDWVAQHCGEQEGARKCLEFRTKTQTQQSEPLFHVVTDVGNLEAATSRQYPRFERLNGKWFKFGKLTSTEAKTISGRAWDGIYASADCEVTGENAKPHLAVCLTAILSNGKRSAVIETGGIVSTEYMLNELVKKFEFVEY
jgi:hypothetical protein